MTTDEQLAAIRATAFFTDLRAKMQAISAAMTADAFQVQGSVITTVDGVTVVAQFTAEDVSFQVGQDDNGNALYEWHAPLAWVS